jgi:hypothetical protein
VLAAAALAVGLLAAVALQPSGASTALTTGQAPELDASGLAAFAAGALTCSRQGTPDQPGPASTCLGQLITRLLPAAGSPTVLAGARDAVKEFPAAFESLCHENFHIIGEFAGRTYGDVDAALAAGGPDCQFGYFHGVIEGYARVSQQLWSELPSLCLKLTTDTSTTVYQECSHSLGHAVVTRTDDDVPAGVERCRLLSSDTERSACATGVFMSWSNHLDDRIAAGQDVSGRWAWAPVDQRWAHCAEFEDLMAGACMLFFAETVQHDAEHLGEFREECLKALAGRSRPAQECHRGVGRVSGAMPEFETMGRWPGVIEFCTRDQEHADASLCAQQAYGTATGFQAPSLIVEQACAAWEGSPHQDEQCTLVRDIALGQPSPSGGTAAASSNRAAQSG